MDWKSSLFVNMSEEANKIVVSVAIITYNQQDTIAQTLDSILCQQGDFDLEVVVGEDCSADNTWKICDEYAKRYPDKVKLLPNTHNLGIMANEARTLRACKGTFIASIAGDDYYIDDHALEKQVDYMHHHLETGAMGTNGYKFFVKRNEMVAGLNPTITKENDRAKEFYFSKSYVGGVYFCPVGFFIRREFLKYLDFDEMIRRGLPVEDYPIQAILSQYTQFACLSDLMVVYRVYKESATFVSLNDPGYLDYHKGLVETRRYLNELFPKDAHFTEADLIEYLFYKEFLLRLHQLQYNRAKALVLDADVLIKNSMKVRRAHFFVKSRFHFLFAYLSKEYKTKQELKKRI